MGHWAEIDENNIVKRVIVIKESELDTGNWGDKSKWIKTSYNTRNGKHYVPNVKPRQESADQSKALGWRFAGVGMKYDAENDVFYNPNPPFASWTFSKTTWDWEPPIEHPKKAGYMWDEDLYQSDNTKGWIEVT